MMTVPLLICLDYINPSITFDKHANFPQRAQAKQFLILCNYLIRRML